MTKYTALFLLKVFALIWQKYFAPQATAAINTAVQNRLTVLINAVKAGNIPNVSWAKVRAYLATDDGSVVLAGLQPIQGWTAVDWAAEIQAMQVRLATLQARKDDEVVPKAAPDQETLDFWNGQNVFHDQQLQSQIDSLQAEIDAMQVV